MWLKRDEIIEIRRFGSSKDFVSKKKYLIVYSFFNFEPVYRSERRGSGRILHSAVSTRGHEDGYPTT